jgi:hypothetical protein
MDTLRDVDMRTGKRGQSRNQETGLKETTLKFRPDLRDTHELQGALKSWDEFGARWDRIGHGVRFANLCTC